ncbi:MAG: hypothetical protein QME51_04370, partial [Planctomycetota bacterium]|nr:hypothetical protein [Planctomycetota bacterium]
VYTEPFVSTQGKLSECVGFVLFGGYPQSPDPTVARMGGFIRAYARPSLPRWTSGQRDRGVLSSMRLCGKFLAV